VPGGRRRKGRKGWDAGGVWWWDVFGCTCLVFVQGRLVLTEPLSLIFSLDNWPLSILKICFSTALSHPPSLLPSSFATSIGHELGLTLRQVTCLSQSVTEQLKALAAAHPEALELHYSYQEQTQQETAEQARRAAEEKALMMAAARQTQGGGLGRGEWGEGGGAGRT